MTAVVERTAGPGPAGLDAGVHRTPSSGSPVVRRGAVAVATVLALGGLLWSLLLWAPTTVELSSGSTTFAGSADVVSLPDYGVRGTHVVDYRHGATVEITVPLRNDGPLPVTVEQVVTGAGVLPLLEVRDVEGLPLSLGAGESGEVVVRAVLGNCAYYHEREVQNVDGLRLEVSVLGRSTGRTVALDRPLLVHSPMIVGCPDRKLDRQANDRTDAL